MEEKLEHVAQGHGVIVLPLSVVTFYTRPDVTCVPIADIPPNQMCLDWDSTRRNPLTGEFATTVTDLQGRTDESSSCV
ncbi:hypothetical protein ACIBP6_46695 [Nonomuraea terrae]|uniref:hypothetical protein n=1 Tax=Nonomuraea terrae TaxID=2530383 RepID=UPI0037B2CDCA